MKRLVAKNIVRRLTDGNAVPPMFAAAATAHLVFDMTGYPETALMNT